ncbi:nucleophile aminohydrolase, partial [Ochromonadaceae sp. CCMP2298]
NYQPVPDSGIEVPGYYNLPARGIRLEQRLSDNSVQWNVQNSQALQLDTGSGYAQRLLKPLLPIIKTAASADEQVLVNLLSNWDGDHKIDEIAATIFNQIVYQLAFEAVSDEMGDKMGDSFFATLIRTRVIDFALPRLAENPDSPWWDNQKTSVTEDPAATVTVAWRESLKHLRSTLGNNTANWQWGKAHTLTHEHPLGQQNRWIYYSTWVSLLHLAATRRQTTGHIKSVQRLGQ